MTNHRAAAEAALAAAKALPGESTRTELLLEAIAHAVLATGNAAATPATPREQILAIIQREGGRWDAQRLIVACQVAGIAGRTTVTEARHDLSTLHKAGHLVQVSAPRAKPVYELPG